MPDSPVPPRHRAAGRRPPGGPGDGLLRTGNRTRTIFDIRLGLGFKSRRPISDAPWAQLSADPHATGRCPCNAQEMPWTSGRRGGGIASDAGWLSMGDVLAVQPGRMPAVGLGPILNAARFRRGRRLREVARPLGLSASHLLDVEAGLCRPSRAVAELLADGLQLNDAARAHLFACGDVVDPGHHAGRAARLRGAGAGPRCWVVTPFVAASSTGAPMHGPRAVLARRRWSARDLGGVRGDSERTR